MISSVVPNDSKMASCCFFMPPIENQRIFGMSDLLTNRLIVNLGQFRKFNFSLLSYPFVQFHPSNLVISLLSPYWQWIFICKHNLNLATVQSVLSSFVFPGLPGSFICIQIFVARAPKLLLGKSTLFPL